jgi:hypothetical protein
LQKPTVPPPASLAANANEYTGWYQMDSPRLQMFYFVDRLLELARVHFADGKLFIHSLRIRSEEYVPVTGAQFRHLPKKDLPAPVATVELLTPNAEGRFI